MNFFQAFILSIVEGITEFLPISSTGHLILTSELLQVQQTEFVKSFEIIIQLGAICAIIFLYWKRVITNFEIWKKVFTAFIPTMVIGFVLYKFIKEFLIGNSYVTLFSLLVGGILLIILEIIYREKDHHADTIEHISYKNAFLIGFCQILAVIPGVSRSASTIIGAIFLGTKRIPAVEFSFLLAVPTMLAATVLDLYKTRFSFSQNEYGVLLVGFIGAFITAILAVKFLLKFIKNHTFIPFGIYRIIVSVLFLLLVLK